MKNIMVRRLRRIPSNFQTKTLTAKKLLGIPSHICMSLNPKIIYTSEPGMYGLEMCNVLRKQTYHQMHRTHFIKGLGPTNSDDPKGYHT
jgi:hypothetical protein